MKVSLGRWLTGLLLAAAGAAHGAESVQSLRYGVSLFHLYQGDYFNALTELMVGQTRQELGPHDDNAELLRGGIALSYGMDREAEQVFLALLDESRPGVDRGRAWFYLARLAWQRGELERAARALAKAGELPVELADEGIFLAAMLALRSGDGERAASLLETIDEASDWRFYLDYNLGAAHASLGDFPAAASRFASLEQADTNPELKALKDRAYTASGYAWMAAGEFERARIDFQQVRLGSPVSDRALLGFGWAAMEGGDVAAALSPWESLSRQSAVSQSVRESLLAIPYAYQQLGRDGLALMHYRSAADRLELELEGLRHVIAEFRDGDLPGVLQIEPGASEDWLVGEAMLPVSDDAPWLRQLIASHAFQASMRELRDLQRLRSHLHQSSAKLDVLAEADREQQANWAQLVEGDGRERLAQRREELASQLVSLRLRLQEAERVGDGRAFADSRRREQWQRVERATALSQRLDAPQEQRRLLELYRGLLIWEDNEQFPDRRWRQRRELAELEATLDESTERLAALDRALANRRVSSMAPRLQQLAIRVDDQRQRVDRALGTSESALRQVAVAELTRQERAIVHSLGQARLAVARLYDNHSAGASP